MYPLEQQPKFSNSNPIPRWGTARNFHCRKRKAFKSFFIPSPYLPINATTGFRCTLKLNMKETESKCRTVPCSPEKENHNSNWLKTKKAWNNVLFMRLNSSPKEPKSHTPQRLPLSEAPLPTSIPIPKFADIPLTDLVSDKTSLLSDEILLKILSRLPKSQMGSNFLVSKRWLNLQGRLVRSVRVLDWDFLISGRLFFRFPNLVNVDLINGCLVSNRNSGIVCTNKTVSFHVGSEVRLEKDCLFDDNFVLNCDRVDEGLSVLARGCPNLRKLVVINASELGLLGVAEECPLLQELDLIMCNDHVLRGIAACQNLQVLRLMGVVDGFFDSFISDIGLTILAQGCKQLAKLELNGCRGGYEGVKAIGQCCQMLQELTLCNHKMEDGWLLALPYCLSLRTVRLVSCKRIDGGDEFDECWECCPVVEQLCLEKCQLRDMRGLRALFHICCNAKDVVLQNCWGMNDDAFGASCALREVQSLSLEGCSVLTSHGLESVIVSLNNLQSLKVKSCNNIKDCEVNPVVSGVFSALKDLQWQPDTKSMLEANLEGTGMRKRGNKFFKKSCDWKSLPGT